MNVVVSTTTGDKGQRTSGQWLTMLTSLRLKLGQAAAFVVAPGEPHAPGRVRPVLFA